MKKKLKAIRIIYLKVYLRILIYKETDILPVKGGSSNARKRFFYLYVPFILFACLYVRGKQKTFAAKIQK